ncbi:asparaginase [Peptostreptococcaceae bacterium AGR-M142]
MKKILLIATGGTIACSLDENGLSPKYSFEDLLDHVKEVREIADINGIHLMSIDSTNMNPVFWKDIAKTIKDNYSEFDGFVVTHGTDTMAYTSAGLSYMLNGIRKPVVLTGAQFSIEEFGTDAKQNLFDAIKFATENICGVFVAFDGKIINGTRAMKTKTRSLDAFESVNYPYIAKVKYGKVYYNEQIKDKFKKSQARGLEYKDDIDTNVMLIKLFPGINPSIFDYIKENYKGVIIESFGIGGIPFENHDITSKVVELVDAGICVAVTTQCTQEGVDLSIYEVGRKLIDKNIIFCKDMSREAIVSKLMWALGNAKTNEEVKEIMNEPVMDDIDSEVHTFSVDF